MSLINCDNCGMLLSLILTWSENCVLNRKATRITQSGGFLGSLLSKIAGPLMKVAVPLTKDILALL